MQRHTQPRARKLGLGQQPVGLTPPTVFYCILITVVIIIKVTRSEKYCIVIAKKKLENNTNDKTSTP